MHDFQNPILTFPTHSIFTILEISALPVLNAEPSDNRTLLAVSDSCDISWSENVSSHCEKLGLSSAYLVKLDPLFPDISCPQIGSKLS